ncbi:MAG TPA: trypsin-like peptidase domain-containing protein [Chloroflexia bacterium]
MPRPLLSQSEIAAVGDILERLYQFKGTPQQRAGFIVNADLGQFTDTLDLYGPTGVVAREFLNTLNTHGRLSNQPTYHALGKLFAYLLRGEEVGYDDQLVLANLVAQHGLVSDPSYLQDLRAKYGVTVPDSAAPSGPLPGVATEFPAGPNFTPKIQDYVRLEQVLNSEDNFLDMHLLLGAIYSARAVARVEYPKDKPKGTGFLIGPNLLLTNQHVLPDSSLLQGAAVRFGYIKDMLTVPLEGQVFNLVPGFYHSSPKGELDYALVQIDGEPLKDIRGGDLGNKSTLELIRENKHRGYLRVSDQLIQNQERVNIIQHPSGDALKVVLTQNYVTATMTDQRVHYLADTDDGSSGSPVFNDLWEVVALHHGSTEIKLANPGGGVRVSRANEGIPMRAILADLREKNLLGLLPDHR